MPQHQATTGDVDVLRAITDLLTTRTYPPGYEALRRAIMQQATMPSQVVVPPSVPQPRPQATGILGNLGRIFSDPRMRAFLLHMGQSLLQPQGPRSQLQHFGQALAQGYAGIQNVVTMQQLASMLGEMEARRRALEEAKEKREGLAASTEALEKVATSEKTFEDIFSSRIKSIVDALKAQSGINVDVSEILKNQAEIDKTKVEVEKAKAELEKERTFGARRAEAEIGKIQAEAEEARAKASQAPAQRKYLEAAAEQLRALAASKRAELQEAGAQVPEAILNQAVAFTKAMLEQHLPGDVPSSGQVEAYFSSAFNTLLRHWRLAQGQAPPVAEKPVWTRAQLESFARQRAEQILKESGYPVNEQTIRRMQEAIMMEVMQNPGKYGLPPIEIAK